MEYNDLTARQKVALFALTFCQFASVLVIGIILGALIYSVILLLVFLAINAALVIINKKIHAPELGKAPAIFMCYNVTNLMFFMCIVVIRYASGNMAEWKAVLLGVAIIAFASIVLSGIFYYNPKQRKHQQFTNWVRSQYAGISGPTSKNLIAFATFLDEHTDRRWKVVFRESFLNGKTQREVAELLDMVGDDWEISRLRNKIAAEYHDKYVKYEYD